MKAKRTKTTTDVEAARVELEQLRAELVEARAECERLRATQATGGASDDIAKVRREAAEVMRTRAALVVECRHRELCTAPGCVHRELAAAVRAINIA